MSSIRVSQIVASLIVVLVCTNTIVQGTDLYHQRRDAKKQVDKAIVHEGHVILEEVSNDEMNAEAKALQACVDSGNDYLIRKTILKTLTILNNMDAELALEAQEEGRQRRSYESDSDSNEDFDARGSEKEIHKVLSVGKIFLSLLPADKHKAYDRFAKQFEEASPQTKKDFVRLFTRYARKCADGIDFKKRFYNH